MFHEPWLWTGGSLITPGEGDIKCHRRGDINCHERQSIQANPNTTINWLFVGKTEISFQPKFVPMMIKREYLRKVVKKLVL